MKKKEEARIREILFGDGHAMKCDIPALSRETGIPQCTLRRYKKYPDTIPLAKLLAIVQARGLTATDAGYLITGRKAA